MGWCLRYSIHCLSVAVRRGAEQASSTMFLRSLAAAQADAGEGTVDNALAMEMKLAVRLRLMLAKAGLLTASGNEAAAADLTISRPPAPNALPE
jgi:hypothetical protein